MENIRVRFAPSPTGPLHIGGVRTALYDYIFAKKYNGTFILRIEDTDQARFVPGAEKYIIETLNWLGLTPDEGPEQGGPVGPYRQSERTNSYKPYVQNLLDSGHAYYAFDTHEELETMRVRLKAARVPNPQYNSTNRSLMRNALTLSKEQVADLLGQNIPYVVRFKMPHQEDIRFYDIVRGWVKINSVDLDDKVIMKADGTPTYHFANIVDDYAMRITHVIRGEEWISSTPLHILLYKYLGLEPPQFVHLPLLLKPEGTGKLSKRDTDVHGFPVFPIDWRDPSTGQVFHGFREAGYLPEALLNFLAMLGWSPGSNEEFFHLDELVNRFSLDRIGKSGVKFNIQKAQWFNQMHLKRLPLEVRKKYLCDAANQSGVNPSDEQATTALTLLDDRAIFPKDLWEMSKYLFVAPIEYDMSVIKKNKTPSTDQILQGWRDQLSQITPFTATSIKEEWHKMLEKNEPQPSQLMPLLRVVLTGERSGPDLMQSMEFLGAKQCSKRIQAYLSKDMKEY